MIFQNLPSVILQWLSIGIGKAVLHWGILVTTPATAN
jgi:hypothetical protein